MENPSRQVEWRFELKPSVKESKEEKHLRREILRERKVLIACQVTGL
jgi:hypothetical protein